MSAIPSALALAREMILSGLSLPLAVAEAAEESGLNPRLIERKLSEQHGVPIEALADTLRQRAADARPCLLPPPAPPPAAPARRQRNSARDLDRAIFRLLAVLAEGKLL